MCGITGWADLSGEAAPLQVLERMNDAVAHRGPDAKGVFLKETRDGHYSVGLGHRRLSIIDLSTGAQPMHSTDGMVTVVFNGEIYNFVELRDELRALGCVFVTSSDTEVLICAYQAWGSDCVRRLRGMFAFALWDAGREQLFLARDRFGKKPLFLRQDGERLLFGSEIKSILGHPGARTSLDRQSVYDYFQYRYVPGPHTMFSDIVKLPPGSFAVWQAGRFTTGNYYFPPDGQQTRQPFVGSDADALRTFTEILDESVQLRMVADVPFGAFLSGGIDSSAVVALMSRHSHNPINTFSVGFEEQEYNETRYAREVAKQFKTNHHEWLMKAADVITLLPQTVGFRDAPIAEPADVAIYVLSKEAVKTVKMVLTGEGSDEILAGYPKHRFEPYAHLYQSVVPSWAHDGLIEPLVNSLPSRFYRLQTLVNSFGLRDPTERLPRWFGSLTRAERDQLVAMRVADRPVDSRPFAVDKGVSAFRRCLYFDQTSWLPDNLLERGDRMTMAAGIETRMPFMDHKLAEFVASCPDKYLIRGGEQKWLLRQAMKPVLPSSILYRSKIGFRVPVNLWFRTSLRAFVYDHLLGQDSLSREFYRRDKLELLLGEHVSGRHNHEKLIWALLNLELFMRHYWR